MRRSFAGQRVYSYQNVAFSLIGDAIERRSKITYRAFVEEKIFSPLGMQDAWLGEKAPPGRVLVPLMCVPRPVGGLLAQQSVLQSTGGCERIDC